MSHNANCLGFNNGDGGREERGMWLKTNRQLLQARLGEFFCQLVDLSVSVTSS